MKKTIITTFAVSAVMLLSSATVFAATSSTTSPLKAQQITSVKAVSAEIKGTVKDISDSMLTVKTTDGVTYSVPLDEFSKQDGFKDLGLDVGTEVSLKSEPGQIAITDSKELTQEDIKTLNVDQNENILTAVPAKVISSDSKAIAIQSRPLTPDEIKEIKEGKTGHAVTITPAQTTGDSDSFITIANKGNLFC